MSDFIFGLDLGQKRDFTALAIIERVISEEGERKYHLRHLERFKLGTTYPVIIRKIIDLLLREELKQGAYLVIDSTGVGLPVVDLLRQEGLNPIDITITAGTEVNQDDNGYRVPKRDLVTNLQVLFESDMLKIAEELPDAKTLVEELMNFKVKLSKAGHDSYEAWREGVHDDLVLAVALACWYGQNMVESFRIVTEPPPDWDGRFF